MFSYLIIAGLTGMHGVLTAKSALKYHRQAQSGKGSLSVKLICASLLVLAFLVMLTYGVFNVSPIVTFFCGWLLAAIATLPLTITGVIEVINAFRHKHHQRRNITRLLLNFLALLIYCILALWMSMFLAIALSGEPYMGK
ncbi:MAG TPA: hypothetical protein V6C85_38890 [Allocoleopsis sp.]